MKAAGFRVTREFLKGKGMKAITSSNAQRGQPVKRLAPAAQLLVGGQSTDRLVQPCKKHESAKSYHSMKNFFLGLGN
jgi:hypothetical protein